MESSLLECSKCKTHFRKPKEYQGTSPLCTKCRTKKSSSPKQKKAEIKPPWSDGYQRIDFSYFDKLYPKFPSYLGVVTHSACGYSYSHCETGLLVHSQYFEKSDSSLSLKYDGDSITTDCLWFDDLKKSTAERPSDKHFLIIFSGIKQLESKTIRASTSQNPQFPAHVDGWWTDRWPTHEEALILKARFGDFSFGKPPKVHAHGN